MEQFWYEAKDIVVAIMMAMPGAEEMLQDKAAMEVATAINDSRKGTRHPSNRAERRIRERNIGFKRAKEAKSLGVKTEAESERDMATKLGYADNFNNDPIFMKWLYDEEEEFRKGSRERSHSSYDHTINERMYNREGKEIARKNSGKDFDSDYNAPELSSYEAWIACIDEMNPLHIGGNGQRYYKAGDTYLVLDAWQKEDGSWYKTIESTSKEEVIKCYNSDIMAKVANFARKNGVEIKAADLELPEWLN